MKRANIHEVFLADFHVLLGEKLLKFTRIVGISHLPVFLIS